MNDSDFDAMAETAHRFVSPRTNKLPIQPSEEFKAYIQSIVREEVQAMFREARDAMHYSPYDTPEIEGRALDVLDEFIDRVAPEELE